MKARKRTMEQRLGLAHQAIHNALDSEKIMAALAEYNYDETRMSEGLALLENAKQLYQEWHTWRSEQLKATETLKRTVQEARAPYSQYLQIARLALKDDPSAVQILGLKGSRKRTLGAWLEEAKQFFTNALSEEKIGARLADYGITRQKLEAGKALLEKLELAAADQEKKKGKAQQMTRDKNQAFKELDNWISMLRKVARFAMKGKEEELLEALGILVRSS